MLKNKKWEIVNKRARKENYTSFYKYIDYCFSENTPSEREELRSLMTEKGFRTKDNEKLDVTTKQVDKAWEYIQKTYFPRQTFITDYYKTEKYRKYYVYRATRNIEYKGKKYKRGQFLPKKVFTTTGD